MTAPVDVLAVLRRVSRHVPNEDFVEFDDALHSVAELIEAAHASLHWESGDGRPERQRLRAALARVGGA